MADGCPFVTFAGRELGGYCPCTTPGVPLGRAGARESILKFIGRSGE
jgi:hypothetical protein